MENAYFSSQYRVCFGTGYIAPGDETYNAVKLAISLGYRIIDTAHHYKNESDVGRAIRDSGIDRSEFIVITKLTHGNKTRKRIYEEFYSSLKNLDIDYIDIYLIHAPRPWNIQHLDYFNENIVAFNTLSELKSLGKVKSVGVSNFEYKDIQNIIDNCNEIPSFNQIPFFVGKYDSQLIELCRINGIALLSNSSLAKGKLLENTQLFDIANYYKVNTAQLCLRYVDQKGVIPIIRSNNSEHLIENLKLDFTINQKHMNFLDSIVNDPRIWD